MSYAESLEQAKRQLEAAQRILKEVDERLEHLELERSGAIAKRASAAGDVSRLDRLVEHLSIADKEEKEGLVIETRHAGG